MPSPIFQIQKDDKRMCVYSQRDLDYMVSKGWGPVVPPAPPVVEPVSTVAETPKKRGRPKAH